MGDVEYRGLVTNTANNVWTTMSRWPAMRDSLVRMLQTHGAQVRITNGTLTSDDAATEEPLGRNAPPN